MTTVMTQDDFDTLALEGSETIGYRGGQVAQYDVGGYDQIPRRETSPDNLASREIQADLTRPTPPQAQFSDAPYPVRMGGFRRHKLFGPDAIGRLFRERGIVWNDGLGNGTYESLLINRKYGLAHTLEAPMFGYDLPYLEEDWPAFRETYGQHLSRFEARLREMEAIYGAPILGRAEGLAVLNYRETPLSTFYLAYQRNPDGVRGLLEEAIGCPAPPVNPTTSEERATLSRFWTFIRLQQGRIIEYQAEQLRAVLGPGTALVGNFHELPHFDFDVFGRVYDYPAVAIRPLLLDDEVMLRHYTAYFTQLNHDLTGKPPIVSVRINLSAAGCRFVPGANLIRRWHDEAVRHGAGAFYLWPRDYPLDRERAAYDGPMVGNPIAESLPRVRWDSSLEVLGQLSTHRRFLLPPAEVAILVPRDAALLQRREWRRIYAAFAACAEARVHCRFVSDVALVDGGLPDGTRLLLAPALEFISDPLRKQLEQFTAAGGTLLLAQPDCFDPAGRPAAPLQGAQLAPAELCELFSLGEPSSSEELARSAAYIREQVDRSGLEDNGWLFDIGCHNLPPAGQSSLREPEPEIQFEHWMYEHGSDLIFPFIEK